MVAAATATSPLHHSTPAPTMHANGYARDAIRNAPSRAMISAPHYPDISKSLTDGTDLKRFAATLDVSFNAVFHNSIGYCQVSSWCMIKLAPTAQPPPSPPSYSLLSPLHPVEALHALGRPRRPHQLPGGGRRVPQDTEREHTSPKVL